ncbi:MAG: DUF697 domain-containing protein [Phycisphaerae bacterium]
MPEMPSSDRPTPDDALFTPHELVLDQARTSLSAVMGQFDLEGADRAAFEREIEEVEAMMAKLDCGVIHIAVFGMVSRGKSALLNALLGQDVFEIGATHGTTQGHASATWNPEEADGGRVGSWSFRQDGTTGGGIELIDTPGLNEIDGEARSRMARQIARRADLLLFVVSGDMLRPEQEALSELRGAKKPIIVVFNMIDLYPEQDRDKIYQAICDERVKELVKPEDVVLAAGKPKAVRVIVRQADGTTQHQWHQPEPQVADLKLKILEVLEREGHALAALNTMLFVDDLNERIIERRVAIRDDQADHLIWRFTIAKAIAVACNPVAVADVAGGIGTDIAMVFALSRLYGISMTRVGIGKLVVEIGRMAGLFTATEVGTHFLVGLAKSFFAASSLFTGGAGVAAYAAVAPIQAFAAGYSSRVIGEAIKVYLRNGASWGPSGPKRVIQSIVDSLDKDSIMRRIKHELKTRLGTQG